MSPVIRHIAVVLALLGIGFSTQGGLVVRTLFMLRHDHIAAHYCVNRSNPEVKCNGMCFLKKRLAEHQKKGEHQEKELVTSHLLHYLPAIAQKAPRLVEGRRTYVVPGERSARDGFARALDPPPRMA